MREAHDKAGESIVKANKNPSAIHSNNKAPHQTLKSSIKALEGYCALRCISATTWPVRKAAKGVFDWMSAPLELDPWQATHTTHRVECNQWRDEAHHTSTPSVQPDLQFK